MYQVRHAAHWTFPTSWAMPTHAHEEFHELIVVVGGAMEVATPAEKVAARAGHALVYPKGMPHEERVAGGKPLEMLFLAFYGPDPRAAGLLNADPQGRAEHAARWAIEAELGGASGLAGTLVGLALHALTRAPSEPDPIAAAQRHVRRNLAGDLSLDALAEVAAMSRFHFARRFAEETGCTPAAFVRRARVEAARTLLLTTPMPLRSIAPLVGLRDEAHLSRVFRRVAGQRPSDVRRTSRDGIAMDAETLSGKP